MEGFTAEDTEGTEGTGFYNRGSERSEGGASVWASLTLLAWLWKSGVWDGFSRRGAGAQRGETFYNDGSERSEGGALVWASLTLLAWL